MPNYNAFSAERWANTLRSADPITPPITVEPVIGRRFTVQNTAAEAHLMSLPLGTKLRERTFGSTYTKVDTECWLSVGGNIYAHMDMRGSFEIIEFGPDPSVAPRPRYTNGRFVAAEDADRFQIGDIVHVLPSPAGAGIFSARRRLPHRLIGQRVTLVGERASVRNEWTIKDERGRVDVLQQAAMSLVTRDVSAPETFADFRNGDRVLVAERNRDARWSEPMRRAIGAAQILNSHVGETEVYHLLSENDGLPYSAWGGDFTLLERDGEPVPDAPQVPRVVRCFNTSCRATLGSEDERLMLAGTYNGCANCRLECIECGEEGSLHYGMNRIHGDNYCDDCTRSCSECDTTYVGDECPNWEDHEMPRGVHHYGHTTPTMWLGGPLPKVDGKHNGYYVGIELEISARSNESAMPIYDWAEENLGHRDAIVCKEDSSVRGFEIVTMPMTPEVFESVNWESFMDLLNENHPLRGSDEPTEHGLHVHIGRVAFGRDDVATAAYSYLLNQGDNLERIGRREAYHYCAKVRHPVSAHISQMRAMDGKTGRQIDKIARRGIYAGRDAVNLQNRNTIEVRAFRSTRDADYLRNAVRLTYLAADYVRYLRVNREAVSPKSLHWGAFSKWVEQTMPEAYPSIAGAESAGTNKRVLVGAGVPEVNFDL